MCKSSNVNPLCHIILRFVKYYENNYMYPRKIFSSDSYSTIIGTKENVNGDKLEALKYIITGPQNPYIYNPL